MKKKAVIYCRVSTEDQAENGYSMEAQEERLKAYAKSLDLEVLKVYRDGGFSGTNTERPALQMLLNGVRNKMFDVILIFKLDRFSRSQKDTLEMIEDILIPNNCDLISLNENFDTSTAFGRAMVGILSVFAQLERENIIQRHMSGKIMKAKKGGYNGGTVPLGYDRVGDKFVLNENAKYIKLAFDMYLQNCGIPTINKKIPHKTRGQIRSWLQTPFYAGRMKFKDIIEENNDIEKLISWEDFCKVQELMDSRRQPHGPSASKNVLAGLCKCAYCGGTITRRYTKNYSKTDIHEYLVCYSVTKTCRSMIKDPNCQGKYHRLNDIVGYVRGELERLLYDDDYFRELQKEDNKIVVDYSDTIRSIEKKIERLLDLYIEDEMSKEVYTTKKAELDEELLRYAQLDLEQKEENQSNIDYKYFVKNLVEAWDSIDNVKKNTILKILIKDIQVSNDEIRINWAF